MYGRGRGWGLDRWSADVLTVLVLLSQASLPELVPLL
eukprot:COSAG02_NODE_2586_length_8475_cov_96.509193_2_plen_37_part_00